MGAAFTLIFEFLGVIAKNPIVQKIALFGFFFGLLSWSVAFFINIAKANMPDLGVIYDMASYFGLLNAISIYLSLIITSFFVKQILSFIRS